MLSGPTSVVEPLGRDLMVVLLMLDPADFVRSPGVAIRMHSQSRKGAIAFSFRTSLG